jgi:hypothetical protein
MEIDKKFPNNTFNILYDAITFLQVWSVNLTTKDQVELERMLEELKNWMYVFPRNDGGLSYIVAI